jgi:hypothetical protein
VGPFGRRSSRHDWRDQRFINILLGLDLRQELRLKLLGSEWVVREKIVQTSEIISESPGCFIAIVVVAFVVRDDNNSVRGGGGGGGVPEEFVLILSSLLLLCLERVVGVAVSEVVTMFGYRCGFEESCFLGGADSVSSSGLLSACEEVCYRW